MTTTAPAPHLAHPGSEGEVLGDAACWDALRPSGVAWAAVADGSTVVEVAVRYLVEGTALRLDPAPGAAALRGRVAIIVHQQVGQRRIAILAVGSVRPVAPSRDGGRAVRLGVESILGFGRTGSRVSTRAQAA